MIELTESDGINHFQQFYLLVDVSIVRLLFVSGGSVFVLFV